MKDLCRICRARLVGNQCRWIFSPAAKNKLRVILSHVLGREVTRDGQAEFLCGKCVFQLERVMKCDVDVSRMQSEHGARVRRLQAEKDHLIQCMIHVYRKNNPGDERGDGRRSTCMDGEVYQANEEHWQDSGKRESSCFMRRCVSLDRIAGKSQAGVGLKSGLGYEGSTRASSNLNETRHRSQSMYLDLIHRKTPQTPRFGFKTRSTSLHSLNTTDFAAEYRPLTRPKSQQVKSRSLNRPNAAAAVGSAAASSSSSGKSRESKTQSPAQTSVVSDLIQVLCCIAVSPVQVSAGCRIPVMTKKRWRRCKSSQLGPASYIDNSTLHELAEEFDDEYTPVREKKSELSRLESLHQQLTDELTQTKTTNENLSKTLQDLKNETLVLTEKLNEKENELRSEKKNSLKRDKTIQGLTQVLSEKENEIAELCHEIEDRKEALSKAREAAHKAQLQKYQGAEEHQNLLMEKQTELAELQGEHHAKVLESQKLQRALNRKDQELKSLQQAKEQLELELEDMQQQQKKGDKALNDLNNQLKKLNGDIKDRENALEQQHQDALNQCKQKILNHEVTIQRLTSSLMDKEQQLQEYMTMMKNMDQSKSSEGVEGMISTLKQRLKDKEKALERALDEKFAALEDKDHEIHTLQLSLREKERDLERHSHVVSHSQDTVTSLDAQMKDKDAEIQRLANTLKNLQRSKQELEENLRRSLREKDDIIGQLQASLEGKTKHLQELTDSMLSQSQSQTQDLTEQMNQRMKVAETMLTEEVKVRERLIADHQSAVEELLTTITNKDQLLSQSTEHHKYMMSQRSVEVDGLRRQLSDKQQQLNSLEKQCSARTQEALSEAAELRGRLEDKERLITKLLQRTKDGDATETRRKEETVLELRQTIQILQEKLEQREDVSTKTGENDEDKPALPNKNIVLKKELLQKTEELNEALKREAELQLQLNELDARCESLTANIESLTATLKTKDEIIHKLYNCISQKSDLSLNLDSLDQASGSGAEERFPTKLPQREQTVIGGDHKPETVASFKVLQEEHESLNRALKAEQQLYSSLVRTVKEHDSAQRLHALQLELTAVQLLRQQLEENVKTNEELRDALEREMQRVQLREGAVII